MNEEETIQSRSLARCQPWKQGQADIAEKIEV